jgi:chitodextrinase
MASPHVAGAAALYRSFNPAHTASQVASALINNASLNKVTSPGTGSPNRLLYMGFIGGAPPPNNQNPVANFTVNCVVRPDGIGADCLADGTSSTDPDGSIVGYNWTATGRPATSGPTTSYPYPKGTTQTITLTVTDNAGATNSKSITFVVGGSAPPPPPPPPPPPTNAAPVANFTYNCVVRPDGIGADCTFNGASSTDSDGTIVSYVWTATARPSLSGVTVTYPYPVGKTPTISLTVRDDDGATNTKTQVITIP